MFLLATSDARSEPQALVEVCWHFMAGGAGGVSGDGGGPRRGGGEGSREVYTPGEGPREGPSGESGA